MRELTFLEPGRVGWTDVPEPSLPGPDGVLVRPVAVARCDLDRQMVIEGLFPGPYPVGHEVVGEITESGEQVHRHKPGDLVLVPFQVSCGNCQFCDDRRFAACHTYRAPAGSAFGFGRVGGDHGGAVADLMAVPHADHMLIPVPPQIPVEVACTLADNAVDGYRSVAPPLAKRPGADVLVIGSASPSVGLYAVATAVALGASTVRYVDHDLRRCEAAERLGANAEHRIGGWPRRFERAAVIVANTDDPLGLLAAIRSTDDYGICTVTAVLFGPQPSLPLLDMYTKGVTLHLSRADSRRYAPEVVEHATAGRIDMAGIPREVVTWEDAARAWLEPATKLVIVRNPAQRTVTQTRMDTGGRT